MKKPLQRAFSAIYPYLNFWGESYFLVPLTILGYYLSLWFVNIITGAQVIHQPDIEGFANNAIGVGFTASLVGMIQKFVFGYAAECKSDPLPGHIHDSTVGLVLFITILIAVWH